MELSEQDRCHLLRTHKDQVPCLHPLKPLGEKYHCLISHMRGLSLRAMTPLTQDHAEPGPEVCLTP